MSTYVDTILRECESIIAETETVTYSFTPEEHDTLDSFWVDLYEVRSSAEKLQSLVVSLDMKKNTKALKLEIVDESITLYQNIKYTLEAFEDEYESMISDEIAKSFSYMRDSVNTIRKTVD